MPEQEDQFVQRRLLLASLLSAGAIMAYFYIAGPTYAPPVEKGTETEIVSGAPVPETTEAAEAPPEEPAVETEEASGGRDRPGRSRARDHRRDRRLSSRSHQPRRRRQALGAQGLQTMRAESRSTSLTKRDPRSTVGRFGSYALGERASMGSTTRCSRSTKGLTSEKATRRSSSTFPRTAEMCARRLRSGEATMPSSSPAR